jgi:hypothetical protein
MKKVILCFLLICSIKIDAQTLNWQSFVDSIPTLSSPRSCDLNNDGIKDIVIGGGTDGAFSNNGIMAFNGSNGQLLWKRASRNEVFGSAIFQDITNDGIKDVFIAGRQAQLLAINGSNGQLLWDYFPYVANPADSGLYNFYNPQFISDVNNDGFDDLLVSNGGDHAAPDWQINRPPGHLMIVSGINGNLIAKAVVPDSAETYCSPIVADVQNNGTKWILFGTGGENLGGSFWACPLNDLINNQSLSNSIELCTSLNKGFIAPASLHKTNSGVYELIIQAYDGTVRKISGVNWATIWSYNLPGTESSAAPVIGNFTGGDLVPDVYLSLFKGIAPSYNDFYQVLLNGVDGSLVFKDSLGTLGYASGNAVDMNNDGRDEAISSLTYLENGVYKNKIQVIDFQNGQISQLGNTYTGVNLGSTSLFGNLDADNELELVFAVKRDSVNPVGWKGIYLRRIDLTNISPNSGVAWGSYMSTNADGIFNNVSVNCGQGSILSSLNVTNPSCNGLSNGQIAPVATNSFSPYTYLWSTGETNNSLNNLSAGSYWLYVTNSNGCYEYRNVNLNDPYTISFGGIVAPICPGGSNGSATVGSTGCPCQFSTCTFLWDNGVTTKPNNALTSGWHSVTINHPGGCIVVDSVLVPEPLAIIVDTNIISNNCFAESAGSIELIPSNYPPNVYNWSNGETSNLNDSLVANDYSVIVSDARGCIDTLTFSITEPDQVLVSSQVLNVDCYGNETGEIQLQAQGGNGVYTYWINQVLGSEINSNLIAGSYAVRDTDSLNCSSQVINVTITEPSSLSLGLSSTPETIGLDGTATASVSGGTAPYTYLWDDSNSQPESLAVYLNSGWYTVSITDANGCQISDSVFVESQLGMEENKVSNMIIIYPNPVKDIMYFNKLIEKVEILDVLGRIICISEIKNNTINLSNLSSGSYTIKLYNQGRYSVHSFVKN